MDELFRKFSQKVSHYVGSSWAFVVAVVILVVWAVSGPIFDYSNSWQLIINTGTTIVTFLMVFLIQNTQNRDSKIVEIKLDELIRAVKPARNHLLDLENLSDDELDQLEASFKKIANKRGRVTLKEETTTVTVE